MAQNKTRLRSRNILTVLPNDSMGGAEQVIKMTVSNTRLEDTEVWFLSKKKDDGWSSLRDNATLKYSSSNTMYVGAIQLALYFFRTRPHYSYIFTTHVFVTGLVGILIRAGILSTNYFVARESTLIFKRFKGPKLWLYRAMYSLGYPSVDLLICQTLHMKEELIKAMPDIEKKMKVKVIPNPVNLPQITEMSVDSMVIPYSSFIVSAGRLIPEKGFDILIHAFKDLKTEFPDLKLVILGEGREREFLTNLAEQYGLSDDIIFEGFVENVFPYFRAAKACVVSSRVEGFPNVLLQMMSQNTSVVSTRCAGGIDEIKGIYTVDPGNSDELFGSIKQALSDGTAHNRVIFDRFLRERSIDRFVAEIENELDLIK